MDGNVTAGTARHSASALACSTMLFPTIDATIGVTRRNGAVTSTVTRRWPTGRIRSVLVAYGRREVDRRLIDDDEAALSLRESTAHDGVRVTATGAGLPRSALGRDERAFLGGVGDRDLRIHQAAEVDRRQQQDEEDGCDQGELYEALPTR
jgi:hypothetical protein